MAAADSSGSLIRSSRSALVTSRLWAASFWDSMAANDRWPGAGAQAEANAGSARAAAAAEELVAQRAGRRDVLQGGESGLGKDQAVWHWVGACAASSKT